ncbi:MAG: O-antigen ligase family protein [Armatimonadota bacterium]|nr:O-antigen ligase family protein [Armatimonadota bacterium]
MEQRAALRASVGFPLRLWLATSLLVCFTAGAVMAWSPPLALAVLGVGGWLLLSLWHPTAGALALLAYTSLHPVLVRVVYDGHPLAKVWKDGAVLWLALMWLFHRWVNRERPLRWGVVEVALVAFAALTVVHLFNPNIYSFSAAVADLRWLSVPLLFYFFGKTLFAGERLRTLLLFLGALATIHAVYGLVQQFLPYRWLMEAGATRPSAPSGTMVAGYTRSFSTMDPYLFGALMSFGAVTALGMAARRERGEAFWLLSLLLTSLGAVFSLARYAWVMLWVGYVSVGMWMRHRLALALAMVALIALQVAPEGLWRERTQDILAPLAPTSTVSIRMTFWKKALREVWQHPFGLGLGTLGIGKWSEDSPRLLGYVTGADNNYLYILVETGWVGLLLYLSAIGSILLRGARIIRRMPSGAQRAGAVVAWTVVLQSAVGNLVNFSTFLPPVSWSLWLCAGALMAQRDEPEAEGDAR